MPAMFDRGFFVREPAWHGLGVVLDEYPGRDEAMKIAGHDFTIIERPLFVGRPVTSDFPPAFATRTCDSGERVWALTSSQLGDEGSDFTPHRNVRGWKALVREDTGHVLSIQKGSYGVIQPGVIWDIADALVNQPNVKYETAGVLKDGAILWVLACLDEPYKVTGDDSLTYPWVCVNTTNDGSGACRADFTDIRVVCSNTQAMARSRAEAEDVSFVFRHTAKVADRIEEVRHLMANVRSGHRAWVEQMNDLAALRVTDAGVEKFVTEFLPEPAKVTKRVLTNVENRRDALRGILNGGVTITPEIRNTAYGLVQAGVEFLDHFRGYHNKETYFTRSVLRAEPLKPRLVKLAQEVAAEYAPA